MLILITGMKEEAFWDILKNKYIFTKRSSKRIFCTTEVFMSVTRKILIILSVYSVISVLISLLVNPKFGFQLPFTNQMLYSLTMVMVLVDVPELLYFILPISIVLIVNIILIFFRKRFLVFVSVTFYLVDVVYSVKCIQINTSLCIQSIIMDLLIVFLLIFWFVQVSRKKWNMHNKG